MRGKGKLNVTKYFNPLIMTLMVSNKDISGLHKQTLMIFYYGFCMVRLLGA